MKKCKVCGKQISRRTYCGRQCYNSDRRNIKICVVCGTHFPAPKSSDTVCCSPKCSSINRSIKTKNGECGCDVRAMREKLKNDPRMRPDENHINAKSWVIQSPDGKTYEFRNLMNWIREHPGLIDGTPKQIFDGFEKIKASAEGKRKHKSYTCKGWKLLGWKDE